jgi:putative ABC transport system substrate-binding protein
MRHWTQGHSIGHGMNRRSILSGGIALVSGLLVARGVVRAQTLERLRRIGYLSGTDMRLRPTLAEALNELGWVEGQNITVSTVAGRGFDGQRERAAPLAKELVAAKVELIIAVAPAAIRAAIQATSDVPIVMAWWGGPDLVESKMIASYARPGGNVTGVDMLLSLLDAKRLEVLHQAVPKATKVAVLVHNRHIFEQERPAVREVARKAGLTLEIIEAGEGPTGYDDTFQTIARSQAQALLVLASPIFERDRKFIIERAGRARVPVIYTLAANAQEGGLMAYGTTALELDRKVARQVDRILRGAKPGDLPVEQPSRYQLVVNLATARALGLVIPQALLLQADQIIE